MNYLTLHEAVKLEPSKVSSLILEEDDLKDNSLNDYRHIEDLVLINVQSFDIVSLLSLFPALISLEIEDVTFNEETVFVHKTIEILEFRECVFTCFEDLSGLAALNELRISSSTLVGNISNLLDNASVRIIEITESTLTPKLTIETKQTPDLKILEINGCIISELSLELDGVASLENITLRQLSMSALHIHTKNQYPSLSALDLSANRLRNLPDLYPYVNLRRLDVSGNNLAQEEIVLQRTLSKLNLSNCQLFKLPQNINRALEIQELKLRNNSIINISGLCQLKKLETLDLSQNPISDIPDCLIDMPEFWNIHFTGTSISAENYKKLVSLFNAKKPENRGEDDLSFVKDFFRKHISTDNTTLFNNTYMYLSGKPALRKKLFRAIQNFLKAKDEKLIKLVNETTNYSVHTVDEASKILKEISEVLDLNVED